MAKDMKSYLIEVACMLKKYLKSLVSIIINRSKLR
jgi:hypothetical protein